MMDHGYRIEGNINSRALLGLGMGKTDPATGVSEMHANYDHSRIEGGVSHLRRGVNGIAEVHPFAGVMVQAGPNPKYRHW